MGERLLFLGVDGGGTGCRARLADRTGAVLGEGASGPTNIRVSLEEGIRSVLDATGQCLAQAGASYEDPIVACLALAGASEPREAAPAQAALRHRFRHAVIAADAHAACVGAHAGEDGGIIIVGTGSIGWAAHRGRSYRVGGWGFPVSDEGSGAWLGFEAVKLAQQTIDGRATPGPLSEAVCAATGADADTMLSWCARANQTAYASLAPLVFDTADTDAQSAALLDGAVLALDALVHALDPEGTLPVVCSGSVARRLQSRLPTVLRQRCREPRGDAADGALHLLRLKLAEAP